MVHSLTGKSPLEVPYAYADPDVFARTGGVRQAIEVGWATSQRNIMICF
jgi:hypothetical protein